VGDLHLVVPNAVVPRWTRPRENVMLVGSLSDVDDVSRPGHGA